MSGLYVRSNVSAITAANYLNRNIGDLSNIMTRLSTGLRINSGKDDPAGLIASELLKADMTATSKAITNVQRANSMVAIADAALGEINNLLNDIRGLVTEAANTATMTPEMRRANQLQIDASIDSIDRIAKTTNYLGKLLLDGSNDFQTMGLNRSLIRDLKVHEANFGTNTSVGVDIHVAQDATTAKLVYDKAGVSVDTVIEVAGNDGSNLVKIAAGEGIDKIAAAINLVSDSTGVRAVVGKESTAGQIFITGAGLDNDINITALVTGANAGNYTFKFTAGDSDQTSYTITEPRNGNPGIVEFKLQMQPHVAPSSDRFDEAHNGIFTYDITGTMGPGGTLGNNIDIVVQTTNGQQIRHVEFVASAGPNASLPGGVAATYNSVTGKLQILYDASGNVTEENLRRAINAIDGFEYLGIYNTDNNGATADKIPSVNVSQIGLTDMYLNHTDKSLDGVAIAFTIGGTGNGVSVNFNGDATNSGANPVITINAGAAATYDDILAALNAPGSWALSDGASRPAANSFKLTDSGGQIVKGTSIVPAAISATTLVPVIDGNTKIPARTEINATDGIYLQTTHTAWNGLEIEIATEVGTPPDVVVGGLTFSGADGAKLEGITFVFDTTNTTASPSFDMSTGTLTIGADLVSSDTTTATALINQALKDHWTEIAAYGRTILSPSNKYATGTVPVISGLVATAPPSGGTVNAAAAITILDEGHPKVTVDFDGTTVSVTASDNATYDDILAALKNTARWQDGAGNLYNGTAPLPPALGLTWVDVNGAPASVNTGRNSVTGLPMVAIEEITTAVPLEEVTFSPASTALQTWLATQGTGTKAVVDLRANNALNITAAAPGTKFENTDIVYVKAAGKTFSESIRIGHQNVYLSSTGAAAQGYTINFRSAGTSQTNAELLAGNILNVNIREGDSLDDVLAVINFPALGPGVTNLPLDWGNFSFVDPTGSPIAEPKAAALVNKTFYLGNVQLNYSDAPTPAAATVTLDNGNIKMRIVANSVGTCYNDVMIEFEQDDSFKPGDVAVVYDELRKILHIRGQIDGADAATYGSLKSAIESVSPFTVNITTALDNKAVPLSTKVHPGLSSASSETSGLTQNSPKGSAVIRTGQFVGDVGGDNQTLFITVSDEATANDVVAAFRNAKGTSAQIAANFIVSNAVDNNGTGTIFSKAFDTNTHVRIATRALTGGNSGLLTNVTAKQLVEFINNDAVLSKLFLADVARGQIGNGFLTLFDEAAYYGSTVNDNALQFLGPKDSPDILFVIDGPSSELGISFVDNYGTGCVTDSRPVAALNAISANAAFELMALSGGTEYDDMIVRMIRLDNNHAVGDSYAVYKSGPSNAMAYCSINNDQTLDGTPKEKGKFIVYANQQGDRYNDVDIVVRLDINQTESAKVVYDEFTKRLIISVNNGDVTLSDAVAAINNEGTFQAEYDFSFNTDPLDGSKSDSPGLETFTRLLSAMGTTEAVIGNTGNTGGHKGGVLEVYVGGKDEEVTANAVINTINNSPTVQNLFSATAIGGANAGTGTIHFRSDNVRQVLGSDGKMRNEVNMVTGIRGSDSSSPGYMIVHLATDKNGNSITTAADLVKFFDMLTPEQSRGISVSVVRPPGVDNLDRIWSIGPCGELLESQLCESQYGLGLLQPTYTVSDCGDYTYYPIEFFSYGEDKQPGNAYGSVIAQNGVNASLDIRSKIQGADFNGVDFKYVRLGDATAQMYAEYDGFSRMITVYVHDGATAAQVKNAIETSEQTKNLFEVSLPGNGSGVISLQDNYLLLKGGIVDRGYRGGAAMLGAADADAHKLTLESIAEGSRQYVSVRWLSGGDFQVKDIYGNTRDTAYGTDMIATINGMRTAADGRSLSLSSAMLKMDIILDDKVTTGNSLHFTITGGGALVQMGPDVVSNQQIRFGLPSVSSAHLGGGSGKLYQLRMGEVADVETSDESRRLADRIVQEAIMMVSQVRGRIGAIQRNTLEPQINALQDSLVAISAAEAQISNADFAEESSRLTRAQILVQAGTRTLTIANQFPQYAAALLGG